MFKFTDYVHEIWTIADKENVAVDIAYDMFKADVVVGKAANTAKSLPEFDYDSACTVWSTMSAEAQRDAYKQWHDALRRGYKAFVEAYPDREKMAQAILAVEKD